MTITEQLKRDEGLRLRAYKDAVGKVTVGYGRNLDDKGLSREEAEYLLANDINEVKIAVAQALPWCSSLDDARLGVLLNMAFNMGVPGLLQFKNTLALIKGGNYDAAADAMLDSHWAQQVGPRAQRLALQMRCGVWQ